jgi:hypothetical protein
LILRTLPFLLALVFGGSQQHRERMKLGQPIFALMKLSEEN